MSIAISNIQNMRIPRPANVTVIDNIIWNISQAEGKEKVELTFNILTQPIKATQVLMVIKTGSNTFGEHISPTKISGKSMKIRLAGINAENAISMLKKPNAQVVLYFLNSKGTTISAVPVPVPKK